MSVRGSSDRGALAQRAFVAVLIVVGLLVSCLVVIRIDPRPAHLRSATNTAGHAQIGAGSSRR